MLVRGIGIRDIAIVEKVSVKKVLSTLVNSNHILKPKQNHYDSLEVDEFWTYVGNKKNKKWLIYENCPLNRVQFYRDKRGDCNPWPNRSSILVELDMNMVSTYNHWYPQNTVKNNILIISLIILVELDYTNKSAVS